MVRFSSVRSLASADAADGAPGSDASAAGQSGVAGLPGGSAAGRGFSLADRSWSGTVAEDSVTISRTALGGDGGDGGHGGDGRNNGAVLSSISGPLGLIVTYGPAGSGADGRAGGDGGAASAVLQRLHFLLRGAPAAIGGDSIALEVAAVGGDGGRGGAPGIGGNSQETLVQVILTGLVNTFIGGAGGSIGDAGAGGDGAAAVAALRDIWIDGDAFVTLGATATGGRGGAGGSADSGATWGIGGTPGSGGNGGAGGDGGRAVAALADVSLAAAAPTTLIVSLVAQGGDGGAGGDATRRVAEGRETVARPDLVTIELTRGPAVAGGAGGEGGDAIARLTGSDIRLGDGADLVSLFLQAAGGAGGAGSAGSEPEFAWRGQVQVWNGKDGYVTQETSATATPAGADGAAGAHGASIVRIADNDIALGGGDDRLLLTVGTGRPGGQERIVIRDNSFDGGLGTDLFGFWGDVGLVLNVARGWFAAGSGQRNALSGFERFEMAGGMDDTITDGAGDQTYDGGGGADRFVFAGRHGRDVVTADFADGAVIVLRGFGPGLDSFAEVLARSAPIAGGTRIVTDGASSIDLPGLSRTALTADMFEFA